MRLSHKRARSARLAVCSAMAIALLAGCAGQASFADNSSAPEADGLSPEGDAAIAKAENRVARSPENAAARAELAQVYLSAGRFDSAATTFEDAVSLGGDNARIGLGMALAYIGAGRNAEAVAVLGRWRGEIPASDFGLAIALAGQPDVGVALLTQTVRGGENNAKTRQNLAYAYALAGQWTQARLIASQDVPADRLDARLAEWAVKARPDGSRERVAGLIGAPVRSDPGQPAALALGGARGDARLARMEAPAPVFAEAPVGELPPVERGESIPVAVQSQEAAPEPAEPASLVVVAETPAPASSARFVSQPVIQAVAKNESTFQAAFDRMSTAKIAKPSQTAKPRPKAQTHLVQLGSFLSRDAAQRGWDVFVKRDPALKNHAMRIIEADVQGKRYYRVAAAGFDEASARAMCSSVRNRGGGCLAYSQLRPLPGTVRFASGPSGASPRAR